MESTAATTIVPARSAPSGGERTIVIIFVVVRVVIILERSFSARQTTTGIRKTNHGYFDTFREPHLLKIANISSNRMRA